MRITTIWGESLDKNNPLPEYPRPQLQRDSFLNLNGVWKYAINKSGKRPEVFDGDIVVPFCPECILSGVEKVVAPDDTLFYYKEFEVKNEFIKDRVFLNFGAVDYLSKIYINDVLVGEHRGGYNSFCVEITEQIKAGKNSVYLEVTDPSDTGVQARGKQKFGGTGIWYTPSSGITQTVWLESVPKVYVKKIKLVPDIDNGQIGVTVITDGKPKKITAKVLSYGQILAVNAIFAGKEAQIKVPDFKLWSPENPFLYDLEIDADGDKIISYFGMRKFGMLRDEKGFMRLSLNNKPYFQNGLLDQGYWSDGMYTPASDDAMIYDIQLAKDMGFNMLRKHIKVEPLRWYYHCDRLGMLCWQDALNGGGKYSLATIGILPFIGIKLDDHNYKRFSRQDENGRNEYYKDLDEMVDSLFNVVSLSLWTIFNEGWGQFDSIKVYDHLKAIDDTRIIDSASGWHDQGGQDLLSLHCYFKKFKMPKDKLCRPVVLSEFGGYSHQVEGHVFSDKVFGYKVFKDIATLNESYKKLFEGQILPAFEKGLAATVYTQVSDVESEINGLVTYDRKVVKFDKNMVKELNSKLVL
jgi:hypothetical protein